MEPWIRRGIRDEGRGARPLTAIAEALAAARSAVVVTGAGMSAESGIPTFRGPDGLWRSHRPEHLATPDAFRRDPALVWQWYAWRRRTVAAASPHAGHAAIARLEDLVPDLTLVTQNVDGLHRRAGSRRVIELHGNILRARCVRGCGAEDTLPADPPEIPPLCACGELMRPDVVWFGEALAPEGKRAAFDAARRADVMLVVGTSSVVYPAAALWEVAAGRRAKVLEVNPERTPLSSAATWTVRELAGAFLPRLAEAVEARRSRNPERRSA